MGLVPTEVIHCSIRLSCPVDGRGRVTGIRELNLFFGFVFDFENKAHLSASTKGVAKSI